MENLSQDIQELLTLLDKKQKAVAMLAPSFIVDFEYPQVAGMLRRLGFKYVVEVAKGAVETNRQLNNLLKNNPDKKFITSPCPTVVRTIRNKYPELVQYLAKIDSPMSAMAKICRKKYPRHKIVHFSPCIVKKLEASEDFPELEILALTYKDLVKIFKARNIKPKFWDRFSGFDITAKETRLYPISGGLAQSSGIIKKFTDAQYDVISGPLLVEKVLQEFLQKPELKVVDILNCEGGCINGPGMVSKDSLDRRRQKVIAFWKK